MVRMVTRTVTGTEAKVLTVNVETQETGVVTITVPGQYKSAVKLKNAVDKMMVEPVIAVRVIETNPIEKLYGMTETEFVKNATELPPRQPKAEKN